MTTDPNDLLMGGGAPAVKFASIGATVEGVVKAARVTQQTDLEGKAKTYDDGNPMQQVEITLLTDERDPETTNDDGARRLFAKGQMRVAIGDALREAGSKLEPGGFLAVTYVGDKEPSKRGYSPAKQFEASYTPGVTASVGGSYATDEEPF